MTTLRTAADAYIVREALDRRARVVVIGAGLIGSEVASAARARGMSVVLLDVQPLPLVRAAGLEAGRICAALHRQAGTDLRVGVKVEALESHRGHVAAVVLRGGTTLAADLVVVDRDAQPATRWLIDSGIMLHPNDGGIVCGPDLRTSEPDVWACGDVAHAPWASIGGDLLRLANWTSAAEQGGVAGHNAVTDGSPTTLTGIPSFWSNWYGHRLQFAGFPHCDEALVLGDPGPGCIVLYRRDSTLGAVFAIDRGAVVLGCAS